MSSRLRFPRPGETWQSVVASGLAGWSRATKWRLAKSLLGDARYPVAFDFPRRVSSICEGSGAALGLNAESILAENTHLRFHRPFLSDVQWRDTLSAALKDRHLQFILGSAQSRIPQPRTLRLCRDCIAEDRDAWGSSHWYSVHQITGVSYCAKHNSSLFNTNARASRNAAFELISADEAEIVSEYEIRGLTVKMARQLAINFDFLVSPSCLVIEPEKLFLAYRAALRDEGLIDANDRIAIQDLYAAIIAFYGRDALAALGCDINQNRRDTWVARLARPPHWHQAPLHHILMIQFLYGSVRKFLDFVSSVAPQLPTEVPKNTLKLPVRISEARIEEKKRLWCEVCSCTNGNRRRQHDALYSWLWRNCHNWLTTSRQSSCQLGLKLNYKRPLDEQLASEVWGAARRLLASDPRSRLSRRQIAALVSRPNIVQGRHPGYPETRRAIDAVVECVTLWAKRRLALAAKSAPTRRRTQIWFLVNRAGISPSLAKRPEIKAFISTLALVGLK